MNKAPVTILLSLFIAVFLQVTVLNFFQIYGYKPDLVLILIIFYAFLKDQMEGAFWGFVGGLLKDVATGGSFGLNALSFMAAGYLVGLTQMAFNKDNPYVVSLVTLLASFLNGLIHYALLSYLSIHISLGVVFKISFFGALYNTILALLLYKWFYRLNYSREMSRGRFF
jgi:rod shape-determining protein MreD